MVKQPCPDCGTLMEKNWLWYKGQNEARWYCPFDGQVWSEAQIALVYHLIGTKEIEMDEMSLYDLDEDGSYYDDDYDDYYDEYPTHGMVYRWLEFRYKLKWFIWRNFKRCDKCKKLHRNCGCLPF